MFLGNLVSFFFKTKIYRFFTHCCKKYSFIDNNTKNVFPRELSIYLISTLSLFLFYNGVVTSQPHLWHHGLCEIILKPPENDVFCFDVNSFYERIFGAIYFFVVFSAWKLQWMNAVEKIRKTSLSLIFTDQCHKQNAST